MSCCFESRESGIGIRDSGAAIPARQEIAALDRFPTPNLQSRGRETAA